MAKDKDKKKSGSAADESAVKDTAAQTAEADNTSNETSDTQNGKQKTADNENKLKELTEKIASLKKLLADTDDKLMRTVAEYDNFRKRSQKEKEGLYSDIKSDIISKILPAVDNFERAAAAPSELADYKKGIEMTVSQLFDILKSLGIEAFGEEGEAFDPNIHNGVMHIEDEEIADNTVVQVFQKGYKTGDRIIRHAMVKVAN